MTALSYAVRDSATMLRRDFRHSLRYPALTVSSIGCAGSRSTSHSRP